MRQLGQVGVAKSIAHIAEATPSVAKNISQPLRLVFMYSLHRELIFEKNVPIFFIASFSVPSDGKDTYGFDGQKNAHAASKPLPIHKVLPAGFSLPERFSAPAKLLRT